MNNRDLKIANNVMIMATARGKSPSAKKRSQMLRVVMPFLSRDTGDALADAIDKGNAQQFTRVWNKVRDEISNKLGHHRSHASNTATACNACPPSQDKNASGSVGGITGSGEVGVTSPAAPGTEPGISKRAQDFLNIYENFGRWLAGAPLI
ncbi:hypothetical protein D3C85_577820 [compost metagenome]